MLKNLLPALTAAALLWSCNKDTDERDPCLQPQITVLRAVTKRHADTGSAIIDTALPFPSARPISNQPVQYIYGGVRRIGTFNLSLSQIADSCRWTLQADSTAAIDTISFYYDRQQRFLSNACGYTTWYNLKRVRTTTNGIDSVVIQNTAVTSDANVINLRIYY